MAAWKPGPGWPSQGQLTYVAALVTIVGALVLVVSTLRGREPWR